MMAEFEKLGENERCRQGMARAAQGKYNSEAREVLTNASPSCTAQC